MGDQKTLAILLRRTLLANDDAILEFLTSKWGRVSVFAKKFTRSKKRAEIDFFRLLEIHVFQGRSSKSLKNAATTTLFSEFENSYEASQIGWKWIERIRESSPEERPDDIFFQEMLEWFASFDSSYAEWCNVAFRLRLLQHTGDCPRFDSIRGDCWFDPSSKSFLSEEKIRWISLPNETRQVCEFLRRSDPVTFHEKVKKLPSVALPATQSVVEGIEEFLL